MPWAWMRGEATVTSPFRAPGNVASGLPVLERLSMWTGPPQPIAVAQGALVHGWMGDLTSRGPDGS